MAIKSIAVLGAGTMGSAFARRLLGAGMRVSVWGAPRGGAARLADVGAQAADTPQEAVRDADVVITMVPTIDSIEETMPHALPAMRPDATWLQMSTIGVEGTERAIALGNQLRPDVVFVDAPVSGSKTPAEQGKLLILASGPAAALDALARSMDVSLTDVSECLGSTALDAPWALAKLEKIERDSFDPDFSLALATKDLHLALDAARLTRQRLPMMQSIAAQWDDALKAGFGDRDVIAAYLAIRPDTTG